MRATLRTPDQASEEKALEAEVFGKWFGNSAADLQEAYGPYSANTTFIGCWSDEGKVLACMRVIDGRRGPLKTLDDLARPPWEQHVRTVTEAAGVNPALTFDIATMAALPGDPEVSVLANSRALYRALYVWTVNSGIQHWIAISDVHVTQLLRNVGVEVQPFPQCAPAHYMGSPASQPVYASIPASEQRAKRETPQDYELLGQGKGLEWLDLSELAPEFGS